MTTIASTTSFAPNKGIHGDSFAPMPRSTREIVREEIQRQKKLDELETKYQNGEISKFEYTVQKAFLNMPAIKPEPSYCCSFGCMA